MTQQCNLKTKVDESFVVWHSEFSGTIDAATSDVGDLLRVAGDTPNDVPLDQKLTVFAPIDEAFDDNDFAQDSHTKGLVRRLDGLLLCIEMKLHKNYLFGVVSLYDMI